MRSGRKISLAVFFGLGLLCLLFLFVTLAEKNSSILKNEKRSGKVSVNSGRKAIEISNHSNLDMVQHKTRILEHDNRHKAFKKDYSGKPPHTTVGVEAERLQGLDVYSLLNLVKDPDTSKNMREQVVLQILLKLNDVDRKEAFDLLWSIKDEVEGETQQFVLKKIREFPDLGGNDAIVDTFLQSAERASEIERMRMLSYLSEKQPLDSRSLDSLIQTYESAPEGTLARPILEAISRAGGDDGIAWIEDRIEQTNDYREWVQLISILGESGSKLAMDYLNDLLDDLVKSGYDDEESINQVRNAILKLQRG